MSLSEFRKRARDEDDDADFLVQSPDHKKTRTLPFRAFPTTKHLNLFSQSPRFAPKPLLTPALTPVETSEDEDEPRNPLRTPPRQKSSQLTLDSVITIDEPMDVDMDMDMDMDFSPPANPPHPWQGAQDSRPTSPRTVVPKIPLHHPQDSQLGGRIPTPIYGYFKTNDPHSQIPDARHTRSTVLNPNHDFFLHRNQRLPSPISEDETMPSPSKMKEALDQIDVGRRSTSFFNTNHTQRGGPATKGKMTLSMGYRADCEKCRLRIPGHYNHIIRA
ncbi:MAG: hypothetical protein Q9190_000510 [Brigantiaea leucoxantha]